jgi:tetratricopeptide (TPR) repeat protein
MRSASAAVNRVIAAAPNFPQALGLRGIVEYEMEDVRAAQADFERAVALKTDVPDVYVLLASIYIGEKDATRALPLALEGVRLEPRNAESHLILAYARSLFDDWKATLESADQGLALAPEDARGNYFRGLALEHLGRKEEALGAFRRFLAAKEGHELMTEDTREHARDFVERAATGPALR